MQLMLVHQYLLQLYKQYNQLLVRGTFLFFQNVFILTYTYNNNVCAEN